MGEQHSRDLGISDGDGWRHWQLGSPRSCESDAAIDVLILAADLKGEYHHFLASL